MTERQRITLVLTASLLAVLALTAAAELSIELELVNPIVGLGEPFDVTARLSNIASSPLTTTDEALTTAMLWPHLQLTRILSDGTEIPIASDRPLLSPSPSSLWVERDSIQVAVRPVVTIDPGASVGVVISNLLRYLPIVDPGTYQLTLAYDLRIYNETFTHPNYGETQLVAVDSSDGLARATGSVDFVLELSDSLAEEDVEWFRQGRQAFLSSRSLEDLVETFAPLVVDPLPYVHACSAYWIGESYQLFWAFDEAASTYHALIDAYPDSVFSEYAEARLAEIHEDS